MNKLARAVIVTTDKFESPIAFDFALTKYGGISSNNISNGCPLSKFTHAVWPGAWSGE